MPKDQQKHADREDALRNLIRASYRFLQHTKDQFSNTPEWQELAGATNDAMKAAAHAPVE